jgi:hypothetical protein
MAHEDKLRIAIQAPGESLGPRWQGDGLSVSFRACQLQDISAVWEALQQGGQQSGRTVSPMDVSHLDLAENKLCETDDLSEYSCLLSLDVSHNTLTDLGAAPATLLHLNASYNHLEAASKLSSLVELIELNLGYNLLTSAADFERLGSLKVLLLPGNRISALHGLAALSRLEVLDLKFNYIDKPAEVRLLALNSQLRSLTLEGNPVAKLPTYRSGTVAILPGLLTLDSEKTPRSSTRRSAAALSAATKSRSFSTRYAGKVAMSPALTLQRSGSEAALRFVPKAGKPDWRPATPSRTATLSRKGSVTTFASSLTDRRTLSCATPQGCPQPGGSAVGGGSEMRAWLRPEVKRSLTKAMISKQAGVQSRSSVPSVRQLQEPQCLASTDEAASMPSASMRSARNSGSLPSGRLTHSTDHRGMVRSFSAGSYRPTPRVLCGGGGSSCATSEGGGKDDKGREDERVEGTTYYGSTYYGALLTREGERIESEGQEGGDVEGGQLVGELGERVQVGFLESGRSAGPEQRVRGVVAQGAQIHTGRMADAARMASHVASAGGIYVPRDGGVYVPRDGGVYVPRDGPETLLESLLRMESQRG